MPGIIRKIRKWRAQRVASEALGRMNDRMLTDIGIASRADIPRYVRGLNI